jgi:hypothetical protein
MHPDARLSATGVVTFLRLESVRGEPSGMAVRRT